MQFLTRRFNLTMQSKALSLAIDGFQAPSRMHALRHNELPHDIEFLLRLVSGDAEAERQAVEGTGRAPAFIISASEFFIEQVLFAPGADAYRVLGASSSVDIQILRRNMALLFRWLHPDTAPVHLREAGFLRVSAAWNQVKTPDRRSHYDAMQVEGRHKPSSAAHKHRSAAKHAIPKRLAQQLAQNKARLERPNRKRVGLISRVLLALFNRQPG